MPEYDITFGEKLSEVANIVVAYGLSDFDAKRAVLYLSLLSTEILLKSMLEQAGIMVKDIRDRSHKLVDLLSDIGQCQVEVEVVRVFASWFPRLGFALSHLNMVRQEPPSVRSSKPRARVHPSTQTKSGMAIYFSTIRLK
jgi:hypothetical protein